MIVITDISNLMSMLISSANTLDDDIPYECQPRMLDMEHVAKHELIDIIKDIFNNKNKPMVVTEDVVTMVEVRNAIKEELATFFKDNRIQCDAGLADVEIYGNQILKLIEDIV